MPVIPFRNKTPKLGRGCFLAPSAMLTGEIEVGEDVSFWFHTVARGDVNWIRIGERTNIQDGSVLHVSYKTHSLSIGAGVVIGHGALVHGCTIEDGALIGMGAQVLDGAVVEAGAQVAAGAVVSPGTRIPSGQLAMGIPARVKRPLTDAEQANIADTADRYVELKNEYLRTLGAGF